MAADAIGNSSEVVLEAKRKSDCSWHPCQVSLCSSGGLSVKFEGEDSEDLVLDVEDAMSCLRVRSVPLQGDDCCYIEEGQHVLAAYKKNSQTLFFDAMVEKVIRVRHSKRAYCRCTFRIKWLFQNGDDKSSTIPSDSIMKLAAESTDSHPVVAVFFKSAENSCSPLPFPIAFDDTEGDIDLQGLLEKQIEKIGNLADVSKEDTPFRVDPDFAGRECSAKLVASEQARESCVEVGRINSTVRRSGRKQNKTQAETENLVTSAPLPVDNFVENRSPLSPLAARAMLAALVSKLPQKIEFADHEEKKCVSVLDYTTNSLLRNGRTTYGGSNSHTVSNIESGSTISLESVKTNKKEATGKKLNAQKCDGALVMDDCKKNELFIDSGSSLSWSMGDQESSQPVRAGRLTRSATKGDAGSSNRGVEARVTRSAAVKGRGNLAYEVEEGKQNEPVRATKTTRTTMKREGRTSNGEDKSTTSDEEKSTIFKSTTRVTRSRARERIGDLDEKMKEALQDEPGTESSLTDCTQKSNPVSDARVSTRKRAFQLGDDEMKLAESDQKQKRSYAVKGSQQIAGVHTNADNELKKKSISSENQPLRCSPRFLPRTRSHTKS